MTAPRFYSWDDDGSPGRALTGNLQNRLKQILVACLVNGYGSKPGAGWTLEHEHANGFTLSNGQNYINFVSTLAAQAPYPAMHPAVVHIYVAESMSDSSGAIIKGANLCSGTYRFGSPEPSGYVRHSLQAGNALNNSSNLRWTVIADDKTAVIYAGFGGVYYNLFTLYMGDSITDSAISNSFVVLGDENKGYSDYGMSYTLCRGYTAPRNLLTGIAEHAPIATQPFGRNYSFFGSANISGNIPANINLQSPRLQVGEGFAGRLRGVVYDDVLAPYGWPVYLRALGLSGSNVDDSGKIVTIGGHQYAYAAGYGGGFIMTTDPVFW